MKLTNKLAKTNNAYAKKIGKIFDKAYAHTEQCLRDLEIAIRNYQLALAQESDLANALDTTSVTNANGIIDTVVDRADRYTETSEDCYTVLCDMENLTLAEAEQDAVVEEEESVAADEGE